ncbi:unnamed protein product, partial [Strongylus vulgaris]
YPDVTFIWKYEKPNDAAFSEGVKNLILSSWTPQSDLLADDRLTLFITHGGAGSMMESATSAKPLIVVPLFGDQTRNAKLITKFGFGIHLNKASLVDSNVLRNAIEEIFNNTKYKKAADRIRDILAKRPFTPEEKLIKTIDLAITFGQIPELLVSGRNLSTFVYHNIDIFIIFTAVCSLILFSLIYCLRRLIRVTPLDIKLKNQ